MRLHVLGTAAGGGVPQWNCACPGCTGARAVPSRRRLHACLAVELAPGRVYLVNATPDIGEQIERCPWLRPDGRRTPLAGVILTDAELDHTLGLARLREADELEIMATDAVRKAVGEGLRLDETLAPYVRLRWRDVEGAELLPVSGKRPRYARDFGDGQWVSALRIGGLVYAPAMGVWPTGFGDGADVVFADGTFWDDDEPRTAGFSSRTAIEMGHLPVTATRERLAALPARCLYTHLNNTNPLVDPGAPQHAELKGVEVASEGTVVEW
ncbi:pyrroloquinoline quinone biosynthesis protein PqqB [Streptomyces roseirectus]|uniref:Coenzyme PQQ synthesis protein B n=1 Tax=Streptomyces roseirectus TaxID=2768066 RepID=A0A7H0IRJ3_9ACTN|nr:MBL fold metallo-hydrolase [Streptomyces roseirectus]QNP75409.1 pyrroloquinoline quinone biosynthesis protein PqqB [Streptomyces roseirectus]